MGNRCNIVITDNKLGPKSTIADALKDSVVLYGHWSGERYVQDAQRALAKNWRWDDPAYLARIVFDEFCADRGSETSFGITSGRICDNEHDVLVICTHNQMVYRFKDDGWPGEGQPHTGKIVKCWLIADFLGLKGKAVQW